jgi:hypothetical protein
VVLRRLLVPSYADWLSVVLIAWLFVAGSGWMALLADGDTGWHIRAGELILDTHRVPRVDPFSFTQPGAPWYAWEWLSDVLFAGAHRALGLKGVVLLAGLAIAAYLTILFRHMLWQGADVFTAAIVCLLAAGASGIHYLARPHVFSLLLLAVALWLIERDRAKPGGLVWLLVPLTALWANLHGGFVALLASLAALAAGSLLEGRLASARRYGLLLAACGAASLANPYGLELHRHVLSYLRSDWIRTAIDEFQSPKFRSESAFDFELLLAAAVLVAGAAVRRRDFGRALLLAGWAHAALVSVRHVPVFALVAAPAIASQASLWWRGWAETRPARSLAGIAGRLASEHSSAARSLSLWPAAVVLALVLLPLPWPRDFPAAKFPTAIVDRHPELAGARVFTSDQWGDYLIYRLYPRSRVFIDGRSDFYGPRLGKLYLKIAYVQTDWRCQLSRFGIAFVLADRDWPLANLLRQDPEWRLADEAGPAILLARAGGTAPAAMNSHSPPATCYGAP